MKSGGNRSIVAAWCLVAMFMMGCSSTTSDGSAGKESPAALGARCGNNKFPPQSDCDSCVLSACCAEANACAADDVCGACITGTPGAGVDCNVKTVVSAIDCVETAKIKCDSCAPSGGGGGGDKCTGLATGGGIRCSSAADCIPTCAQCCSDGYCHAGC